jgi:Ca-activated chloride channel family protein
MSMDIHWERPFALIVLLLVPWVFWLLRRSRSPLMPGRGRLVALVQALALACMAIALAGPWLSGSPPRTARFAIVPGALVDPELSPALRDTLHSWREATPHADPFFVVTSGSVPEFAARGELRPRKAEGAPSLDLALEQILARLPAGAPADVLWLGPPELSGNDPASLLARLDTRGVRLHWREQALPREPLSWISLDWPSHAEPGEALLVRMEIYSDRPRQVELRVRQGESLHSSQTLALRAGEQRLELDIPPFREGLHVLDLELRSEGLEALAERAAIFVEGHTRIAHLCANSSAHAILAQALEPHGIQLEQLDPFAGYGDLLPYAAVLVDDLPASSWSTELQQAVRQQVAERGLGLILTGAYGNLAPGGYGDSPLREALPVEMPQREERRDPSVALVLIIDTSGSMGSRLELAKEVARLAIRRLQPHDKLGLVEFHGSKRWAAPIQPAANVLEITRALNRLQVGGGTIIYSALEEAYYGLLDVRTRFKHVLVLTDGGVESGNFEELARRMSNAGITLSTVLVGPQTQGPFLINLAQWGRGRFYACPNRFQLPELRFKEPQATPLPAMREQPARLNAAGPHEVLDGLDGLDGENALVAGGLVEARPRPGARRLLDADSGPAALVTWDHGLGRVFVFASEIAGPLAQALGESPRFAPWLSELLRNSAQAARAAGPKLEIVRSLHGAELSFREELRTAEMQPVLLVQRGDERQELPLLRAAPEHHLARVPWAGEQALLLELAGLRAATAPPIATANARKDRRLSIQGLVAGTGGTLEGELPLRGRESEAKAARPLTSFFALVALVLFMLSLLFRRLPGGASAAGLLLLALLLPSPALAQAQDSGSSVPSNPEQRAERIRHELASQGRLDALLEAWKDAGPQVQLELAHAEGKLGRVLEILEGIDERSDAQNELRVLVLDALGRREDALRALEGYLSEAELEPAKRFLWLLHRAGLASGAEASAMAAWRAAADAAPSKEARARVAVLAALHGELESALALSEPESSSDPMRAYMQQALWFERAGRSEEADTSWSAAYARAEKKRDRRFILVRRQALARRDGRREAFAELLSNKSDLDPFEREALFSVLRELGRSDEASRLASRFANKSEDPVEREALEAEALIFAVEADDRARAIQLARARLSEDPDRDDTRRALARILAEERQREEAEKLLIDAMERSEKRKTLLGWIAQAQELGLRKAFAHGLDKLRASSEEKDTLTALMLETSALRARGRSREALEKLSAVKSKFETPGARLRLAEALESAQRLDEAIPIYREIWKDTKAEDVGFRLAWLLSTQRSKEERNEAQKIFEALWLRAGSEARRVQVEERVLEVAARNGTLADLAIRLEEELEQEDTPHRDAKRRALVKIYSRARDSITAASLLRAMAREEGRELEALRELSRVHLENDEYRLHERTLRQMMQLDPKGELEYRQELAMAALERGRPAEAAVQLREMTESEGASAISLEFAAGVMMLAGEMDRAVRLYRRAYAQHPDRIETLLLWARAEQQRGTPQHAIDLFCDILLQDVRDDLFLVAVDGLLNLSAPADRMQFALRQVRRRLAEKPDKVYLHRVHQDVLEALGLRQQRVQSVEDCLLVAGMQRSAWLRELFDDAASAGKREAYLDFGAQLLSLGGELPPNVFLEIGEARLRTGDLRGAERAFARARFAPDFPQQERRIARLFEDGGFLREAEKLRRRILIRDDENPRALLDLARVLEKRNLLQEASELYRDATLMLAGATQMLDQKQRRSTRNRSNSGPSFGLALDGMLRTKPEHAALASVMLALRKELEAYPPKTGEEAAAAFANFSRVSDLLRTEAADQELQALTKRLLVDFAKDQDFVGALVKRQELLGDLEGAAQRAAEAKLPLGERVRLALLRDPKDPSLDEQLLKMRVTDAERFIQALYVLGQEERAEELAGRIVADEDSALSIRTRLAQLFGLPIPQQPDPLLRLQELLAKPFPSDDRQLSSHVRRILAAAPPKEDAERATQRAELLSQLADQVHSKGGKLSYAALVPVMDELEPSETRDALIRKNLDGIQRSYELQRNQPLLALLSDKEATEALNEIFGRLDESERRRGILMSLARGNPSIEVGKKLIARLDLQGMPRTDRSWLHNATDALSVPRPLLEALHARMDDEIPEDPLTAILGVELAEDRTERSVLLRLAVSLITTSRDLSDSNYWSYSERLIAMMTPEMAEAQLEELGNQRGDKIFQALLQRRLGRAQQAFDRIADYLEDSPDDRFLLSKMEAWGQELESWDRLRKLYTKHLERAPKLYSYQAVQLANLFLRANDPKTALQTLTRAQDTTGYVEPMRLRILAQLQDGERVTAELRDYARIRMSRRREGRLFSMRFSAFRMGQRVGPEVMADIGKLPQTRLDLDALQHSRDEESLLRLVPGGPKLARRLLQAIPLTERLDSEAFYEASRGDFDGAQLLERARSSKKPFDAIALADLYLAWESGAELTDEELARALRFRLLGSLQRQSGLDLDLLRTALERDQPEFAARLERVLLLDRNEWLRSLNREPHLGHWLAWFAAREPKRLEHILPDRQSRRSSNRSFDPMLLAALLPAVPAEELERRFGDLRDQLRSTGFSSDLRVALPLAGLSLARGELDEAMETLALPDRQLAVRDSFSELEFSGAVPPLSAWKDAKLAEDFERRLAELAGPRSILPLERRVFYYRILGLLGLRYQQAGNQDAAHRVKSILSELDPGLAVTRAWREAI